MGTKLIADIRLFESGVPNTYGNPTPHYIGKIYQYDHMECLDVIQRLLFLLRHCGFGFDDFDHLYLNFTPCIPHGEVRDVNRYNIREFSWYHYVDIGCDVEIFTRIDNEVSFIPSIRVSDENGILKAEQELRHYGRDEFISQIGTITIGKSSVKIAPRKNQYADYYELTPIKIEW